MSVVQCRCVLVKVGHSLTFCGCLSPLSSSQNVALDACNLFCTCVQFLNGSDTLWIESCVLSCMLDTAATPFWLIERAADVLMSVGLASSDGSWAGPGTRVLYSGHN